MYKFSSNSDFNFGGIESVRAMYDGFRTKEYEKRAGAREFLKIAKTKDQTDLHIIAVGAYEGTGFNRNGDCFRDHWCEKNAHYFLDSDRCVHRHHKNKPEDPKYGNVKAAAYNKGMQRIELVVGLDNDKCGDILAEQEKVGHTNWSMASKQAHDICTWCNHKASTDEDRCSHIPDKIGEINKEGQMCGMDNPNPRWFEISYVRRPADRIGMSLQKCASERALKPMLTRDYLQIYTGFSEPTDLLISKKASDKRRLLQKCSEIEKHITAIGKELDKVIKPVETTKLAADYVDVLRTGSPDKIFKRAAEHGVIFSPENFAQYLFGDRVKEAAVSGMKTYLSDIFEKCGNEVLHNEKYEPSSYIPVNEVDQIRKIATSHSLFPVYASARILTPATTKVATAQEVEDKQFSFELAKQYTAYKLAALNYLDECNKLTDDLLFNAVLQNRA
jgi:hypothetical protein